MPATDRRIYPSSCVIGVDGCRAGWIFAVRLPQSGETSVAIADSLASILDGPGRDAACVIVDVPIGLADFGGRVCEAQARQLIGSRRSSVFSSPRRPMLDFDHYEDANAYGKMNGGGLSKQCWGIFPKIREADAVMTPDLQNTVCEGHPELAFTRLRGAPCAYPKRTKEGERERRDALLGEGIAMIDDLHEGLRRDYPKKSAFSNDDFYDACALSLTATARVEGVAWRLGDGARDRRGLLMEIWG